jgi:hypothetical protein
MTDNIQRIAPHETTKPISFFVVYDIHGIEQCSQQQHHQQRYFRNDKRWPSIVGDSLVFSSVTELSSDALVRIRICRLNILYDLDGEDFDYAGFYSGPTYFMSLCFFFY